jgi:hemoglobin-like flavoprotein
MLRGQNRPQRLYEITGLTAPDATFIVQNQIDPLIVRGQEFVTRFYDNLFASSPELQQLFGTRSMSRQKDLFLGALAGAVRELRNPERLRQALGSLGDRHEGYGVRAEYYSVAGGALLQAMEETLGPQFDESARRAWTTVFQQVTDAMKRSPVQASADEGEAWGQ